jgi:hypothetical protein
MRRFLSITFIAFWLNGCAASRSETALPFNVLTARALDESFTQSADIALAPDGSAHFAYVSDNPPYAIRYQPLGKASEFVGMAGDEGRADVTLSLAIAPSGKIGLAYTDDRSGDLIYAERQNEKWITHIVDSEGDVGYFPSLAFDEINNPHISYFDLTGNNLKYAVREGNDRWRVEVVDATGAPGFHIPVGASRLAIDRAGQPHIAYLGFRFKAYDGELRYATRSKSGWQIEVVDAAKGAGGFPSLALDSSGKPWVSYYRVSNWDYGRDELRVAHHDGRRWQIEVADDRDNAGRQSAIALTTNGQPVVAYYSGLGGQLHLARRLDRWQTQKLEGGIGYRQRLVIDRKDVAHLVYSNIENGTTQYVSICVKHP